MSLDITQLARTAETPVTGRAPGVRPALPFSITTASSTALGFADALSQQLGDGVAASISAPNAGFQLPGTTKLSPCETDLELTAKETEQIDKVARDLESVLLYTLLKDMWSTLPKSGLLDGGLGSKFYREMWLEEVSKRSSEVGSGLGLAAVVKRELLDRAKREVKPSELAAR